MQTKDTKSLFGFICDQMEKLDGGQIDVNTAKAQASLAKQANNILNYELERVKTQMALGNHNREFNTDLSIRSVED